MVDNRHEVQEAQESPYDGLLEAAFRVPIFLLRASIGSPPTWNMQLRVERIVENWNKTSQHANDKSTDFRLLTELVSVLIAELGKHIHSVLACPGEHAMMKREIRHIAYDVQCSVISSWLEQATISELRKLAQLFTCSRADHNSIDQEAAWKATRSEIQFERFRAIYSATVRVLLPTYNVEFL